MKCSDLFEHMLSGGHPNSLGRTLEVVAMIEAEPVLLDGLYDCYFSSDEVVRLRVSNAFKRICRAHAEWLVPFIDRFINTISGIDQASTQWTLAELFMRLADEMNAEQFAAARTHLCKNLGHHQDWIVLNTTMKTLTEWAKVDAELKAWLLPQLEHLCGDSRKSVAKTAGRMRDILS